MISKGDKIKFTMPDNVYGMSRSIQSVFEGVAVSDEYVKNEKTLVRVNINGSVTTLAIANLEVI